MYINVMIIKSPKLYLNSEEKTELISIIKSNSNYVLPKPTTEAPILPLLKEIKSVVFDIYGTLFISASGDIGNLQNLHKNSIFKTAVEESGFTVLNQSKANSAGVLLKSKITEYHAKLHTMGIKYPEVDIVEIWSEILSDYLENRIISGDLTKISVLKTAVFFETLSNPVWPMPGAQKTISKLDKSNIKMGLVSNAQFYTPLLFEAFWGNSTKGLGFNQNLVFYSYLAKNAKPSTFMFEKLLEELYNEKGITANETLYIGNDMLNDVKTAKGCGIKTALFAGDARSLRLRRNVCSDVKPDLVLNDLQQLESCIHLIGDK